MLKFAACFRSFLRLTAFIEAKQARGTARRVFESQKDVAEVKEILLKISARIEAFIASVSLLYRIIMAGRHQAGCAV